jgi:putative component of membrane protein insertase Oxa1/YidC/SpoIIIJ protein YidD
MKTFLLLAIRLYQRHISPRKGYSCAHRVYLGGEGCSGHGYRVISRYGVIRGLALLRRRVNACGAIYSARQGRLHSQAGFFDISLPTDCSCGHGAFEACDVGVQVLDCLSAAGNVGSGGSCGWRRHDMKVDKAVKAKYKSNQRRGCGFWSGS